MVNFFSLGGIWTQDLPICSQAQIHFFTLFLTQEFEEALEELALLKVGPKQKRSKKAIGNGIKVVNI